MKEREKWKKKIRSASIFIFFFCADLQHQGMRRLKQRSKEKPHVQVPSLLF